MLIFLEQVYSGFGTFEISGAYRNARTQHQRRQRYFETLLKYRIDSIGFLGRKID